MVKITESKILASFKGLVKKYVCEISDLTRIIQKKNALQNGV